MEITVSAGNLVETSSGAIMVTVFEESATTEGDAAMIDQALDGAITQLIGQGEIKGKLKEATLIHTLGKLPVARVAVAGLGKKEELTTDRIRTVVAETGRLLRQKKVTEISTAAIGADVNNISLESAAQAISEGALLGLYSFRKYLTKENEQGEINKLTIMCDDVNRTSDIERGINRGRILAEAANLARDLSNEPANYMTPTRMAEITRELAGSHGLEVSVLDREQMQELKMGALLGVAQGSLQPPKLIVLHYKGGDNETAPVALVGKGITFDSGGISIKPSQGMDEMKTDMAGAASVIAAIIALAQLKPKINVIALAPCTENLPGGNALKPGDILTAMNGKTIEVLNTDAEGRLILADALCYAGKLGAGQIIDVATLTGACKAALGDLYSGALGNNQELMNRVLAAGEECGELAWQMPMPEQYKEKIKSDVADIKNVGNRWAGTITAALFLAEFVGDTPWVHLDIAGTNTSEKDKGYLVKGSTGIPARTLINLVLNMVKA